MANSKILTTNARSYKTWDLKKGNMPLTFTVDINIKTDLKDFRDVLVEAQKIIEIELKKHK